jgi:hypothetical protein
MDTATQTVGRVTPWNKGKLPGQKPPLKLKEIWAIRIRLQLGHRVRELALFNLAIDSKLRGCELVGLRVHDVVQGSHVDGHAEEDPAVGTIRDHGTGARRDRRRDRGGPSQTGAVPLSTRSRSEMPPGGPTILRDTDMALPTSARLRSCWLAGRTIT